MVYLLGANRTPRQGEPYNDFDWPYFHTWMSKAQVQRTLDSVSIVLAGGNSGDHTHSRGTHSLSHRRNDDSRWMFTEALILFHCDLNPNTFDISEGLFKFT
jgi:hypothetical protein